MKPNFLTFYDSSSFRSTATVVLLVFAVFMPRLLGLGQTLTIDEPLWLDRGHVFLNNVATFQFEKTVPSIQPGVTTSWFVGLASRWNSLAAAQAAIAIPSGILILICTYLLVRLIGYKWGLLSGFVLALEPFLVAHGRVAHTDSLLTLFSLTSLLFLLLYVNEHRSGLQSPRYIAASGALLGLAIITKIFALAHIPAFGLILAFQLRDNPKKFVKAVGIWVTVTVITILVAWPAFLVNPIDVISHIAENVSGYAEGTRDEEVTSYWWYYPRQIIFRMTPFTAVFVLFGLPAMFSKNRKISFLTVTLLFTALSYATILSIKGERSGRYVLFTVISLSLVGVQGMRWVLEWVSNEMKSKVSSLFIPIALTVAVILTLINISLHPYYLAYHNPFYAVKETHKLGWGEGLEQAAYWVDEHYPNTDVATFYPRVFEYFYKGNGTVESLSHIPDEKPAIIILYRSMLERGPNAPETDILNTYLYSSKHEPVHTITVNDLPYVWIYKINF